MATARNAFPTVRVAAEGRLQWCRLLLLLAALAAGSMAPRLLAAAAPQDGEAANGLERRAWPPMKHYDIWSAVDDGAEAEDENEDESAESVGGDGGWRHEGGFRESLQRADDLEFISSRFGGDAWHNNNNNISSKTITGESGRQSKVIHLFPVPVDGECLSDDGRRTGTCFNAYECRLKGGQARGECAMGFGVCCIFIASCNQTISNNITYLVSPNFPSFMPNNFSSCSLKVKMLNADISQLRIDFYHFSLGQPNRRTGVCDGDVFSVSGGPGGTFSLCGQNSGQHIYYDVGSRALPRQTLYGHLRPLSYAELYANRSAAANESAEDSPIDITMTFSNRFLPIRLWEIRIAQIPFSQRAPAGCLQYHSGPEGIIQTFNFAENGRHLANQHYRICMRQELEMCSIMYQPCDEQSFRIGSGAPLRTAPDVGDMPPTPAMAAGAPQAQAQAPASAPAMVNDTPPGTPEPTTATTTSPSTRAPTTSPTTTTTAATTTSTSTTPTTTTSTTTTTTAAPAPETTAAPVAADAANATEETTAAPVSPLNDEVEGSGGGDDASTPASLSAVSQRPRPVSGGFDLLGFLRNALDFRFRRRSARQTTAQQQQEGARQQRQFFSTCTDRITMPCIIEDFIGAGAGFGPLPGCEPVHCGAQFCASGASPCRIESTVTPFYIGVHFGDGAGKGSAEDNIGACLRYAQVQCM